MKKAILLSIILIILGSCTSIPKNDFDNTIDTLIEKPNFNYQIKSLPKQFNIYYFGNNKADTIPSEVQGFLTNIYFYRNKIQYSPKIKVTQIQNGQCVSKEKITGFSIIFDSIKSQNLKNNECFETVSKSRTLYITDSPKNLERFEYSFLVSRESEKNALISRIKDSDQRLIVIDSLETNDAEDLIQILNKKNKEIVERATFIKSISSQDLFSDLMMADRSKERTRKLSRRISRQLATNTRVRDDIDTFFLSVGLRDARNLKPALDYVSAKDFNIFMLNGWKQDEVYKDQESDLVGTLNSDMPIMMPLPMPDHIPDTKRNRKFAIGYDSLEVVMLLLGGIDTKEFIYKGLSGKIRIDRKAIERYPYVFKIRNDGIELLE